MDFFSTGTRGFEGLAQYYKSLALGLIAQKSGTRHKRAKARGRSGESRVVKMGSCQEVESKNISLAVLHYISNHFYYSCRLFFPFVQQAEGREDINITLQQKAKSWHHHRKL